MNFEEGVVSLITFFTSFKPMTGQAAIHQANAVGSWLAIPGAEVLCFGPDAPAPQARLRHVANTPCNAFGTPLLDSMFAAAQRLARHEALCYANGDIIFFGDLTLFVPRLDRWPCYLVIGRRQNVELDQRIDFAPGWEAALVGLPIRRRRGASNALDYFMFRRGTIPPIPAFAIGRPAWDNWMIMDARR